MVVDWKNASYWALDVQTFHPVKGDHAEPSHGKNEQA